MARMFGTDGVRGLANVAPISPEMAMALGRAAVQVLHPETATGKPCVVVGRDPRLSGAMLEGALTAGLCSAGVDVVRAGVLPTPGVAYLTRVMGAMAGVMISASHNPFMDNGIKFFSSDGTKLADACEDAIEAQLSALDTVVWPTGTAVGCVLEEDHVAQCYVDFLASTFNDGNSCTLRIGLGLCSRCCFLYCPGALPTARRGGRCLACRS